MKYPRYYGLWRYTKKELIMLVIELRNIVEEKDRQQDV